MLGALKTPVMDFLNKAENIKKTEPNEWLAADPSVLMTVYYPEWVKEVELVHVVVMTSGEFRGGLILDRANVLNGYKNAIIIRNVDKEMYKSVLVKIFSP